MPLQIACNACGTKFKAPDKAAGRTVTCLKCGAPIIVLAPAPALPMAEPLAPPIVPSYSADETPAPTDSRERATAILTGLLITGSALVFLLLIAVLVIALTRPSTAGQVAQQPPPNDPPANESKEQPETPPPTPVVEEPPPPQKNDREQRLAELTEREKTELAALVQKLDKHKQTLEGLVAKEDALFPKGAKLIKKQLAAFGTRLNQFSKEQAAAVRPIARDAYRLARQREEFLQAQRKLLKEQPAPGDPTLEDAGGLLLTTPEAEDLGQRLLHSNTARAAASHYVKGEAVAAVVKGPFYAGTFQDPDEPDLVAVAYRTQSYRGKTEVEIPVYVFLHRWRGVWSVVPLPGRMVSVLPGSPPGEYKRLDSGL